MQMWQIVVNGDPRAIAPSTTVARLLTDLNLDRSQVAVERNRDIVPRAHYDATELRSGDVLEIVTFVGGG